MLHLISSSVDVTFVDSVCVSPICYRYGASVIKELNFLKISAKKDLSLSVKNKGSRCCDSLGFILMVICLKKKKDF